MTTTTVGDLDLDYHAITPPRLGTPPSDIQVVDLPSPPMSCCSECGKPVLRKWVKSRTADSEVELKKDKKRAADGGEVEDLSEPSKKKTKVTKGRTKGPVDFDKQCGVINGKALPCSRPLTCKTHSVGVKRAVQGRSKPYGELLEWNRASNPNWVEPVKRETKAEKKEKNEKEKAEKKEGCPCIRS